METESSTSVVARIALGVAGGIAAYKAVEVLRLLQKSGCDVRVCMTMRACEFVQPLTFRALTGTHVIVDDYAPDNPDPIAHITFSQSVDLFLIAPATANIIAKLANGIADDFLTSTYLASNAPVIIAPAMNTTMWRHAATRRNLEQLRRDGVRIIEPDAGIMACGTTGAGRLAETETIVRHTLAYLSEVGSQESGVRSQKPEVNQNASQTLATHSTDAIHSTDATPTDTVPQIRTILQTVSQPPTPNPQPDFSDERVVITAGATREDIDPVRFISNRSSGRMGFALAEAACARGAKVTLVCGTTTAPPPENIKLIRAISTQEMFEAVESEIEHATLFIAAAAVADYRPVTRATEKIKKHNSGNITLELEPTPDILASVATRRATLKPELLIIGFAAETANLETHARTKLAVKNLDAIVANDVTQRGAGFDTETNIATIITREETIELPLMPKRELAERLLDAAKTLRNRRAETHDTEISRTGQA